METIDLPKPFPEGSITVVHAARNYSYTLVPPSKPQLSRGNHRLDRNLVHLSNPPYSFGEVQLLSLTHSSMRLWTRDPRPWSAFHQSSRSSIPTSKTSVMTALITNCLLVKLVIRNIATENSTKGLVSGFRSNIPPVSELFLLCPADLTWLDYK